VHGFPERDARLFFLTFFLHPDNDKGASVTDRPNRPRTRSQWQQRSHGDWLRTPLQEYPTRLAALEARIGRVESLLENGATRVSSGTAQRAARPSTREPVERPWILDLTWEDFCEKVQNDEWESFEPRLELLSGIRDLFKAKRSLVQMDKLERKAVAGTYRPNEKALHDVNDWGWFGSMRGSGRFMALVNEPSADLSRALDHIPHAGDVTESQFVAFAKAFRGAFKGEGRKGALATGTRLLAMKRPDQFVPVNSANRRKLSKAFGLPFSTLTLDNYWQRIVVPLRLCSFWQHRRPASGDQAAIWDGRAAFLDSLCYEWRA
jgi:hypothetical protein